LVHLDFFSPLSAGPQDNLFGLAWFEGLALNFVHPGQHTPKRSVRELCWAAGFVAEVRGSAQNEPLLPNN
jgi:hypothetical protein